MPDDDGGDAWPDEGGGSGVDQAALDAAIAAEAAARDAAIAAAITGSADVEVGAWTPRLFSLGDFAVMPLGAGATAEGKFVRVGPLVMAWFTMSLGTGANPGPADSALYLIGPPIADGMVGWALSVHTYVGSAQVYDASATEMRMLGFFTSIANSNMDLTALGLTGRAPLFYGYTEGVTDAAGTFSSTNPIPFSGADDIIYGQLLYELEAA